MCNIFRYMQVNLPPPLYVLIYDIEYSKEAVYSHVREDGGYTHVTCWLTTCLRPEHTHPVSNDLCTNAGGYSLPLDIFVYVVFNPLMFLPVSSVSVITRIRTVRQWIPATAAHICHSAVTRLFQCSPNDLAHTCWRSFLAGKSIRA